MKLTVFPPLDPDAVETPHPNRRRELVTLLTCYGTGSTAGHNLGTPGYSHDFVARAYAPLLERLGEVRVVANPALSLDAAVERVLAEGKEPLHFSILPLQDVVLARRAANVVVPAWEFPDVPDHVFDDNPQNDWPRTADQCDMVLVSGPFTAGALRQGGASGPIRIVPVPVDDAYFRLPLWRSEKSVVNCRAYVFPQPRPACTVGRSRRLRDGVLRRVGRELERAAKRLGGLALGQGGLDRLSATMRSWRGRGAVAGNRRPPVPLKLPYASVPRLELDGIVYTSIFNPDDGRKNWVDLINGFLLALADRDDATLVLKLITNKASSVENLIRHVYNKGFEHRCRLVVICDFLSESQLLELTEATTFYLQATRAEGNCLPLMNHLAAGRPGVSPDHSSMNDYFGTHSGFVVESHPEPAAWPHEWRQRYTTTWGRIVWTSLRDQIRASYRLARENPVAYAILAGRRRNRMRSWAGGEAVHDRLAAAIAEVRAGSVSGLAAPSRSGSRLRDAA
jgi:glycosyltransferase involved in cell wall biosynthesis